MRRFLPLLAPCLLVLVAIVGCGEEEEQVDPQTACVDQDLQAYAEGSASGDDGTASFDLSSPQDTPGRVTNQQIRLRLGDASPPNSDGTEPVWLYMTDPSFDGELYRMLGDIDPDDPLVLDVYDASELPPGEEDLMSVNHLDCSIEDDGSICVQIGFDSAGDGRLGDDDQFVYNATGGTVTIEGFHSRRFFGSWELETGPNLHTYQDDSTGDVEGCFKTQYHTDDPDFWVLE